MEIRPLVESDLPALAEHFEEGDPARPAHALRLQAEGRAVMLVAWLNDQPVGRVLLHWQPIQQAPPEWQTGVSFAEEFLVLTAHRSKGIGAALMAKAERLTREHGYERIALGVGIDNERARALYSRLGYVEASIGPFQDSGTFYNHAGKLVEWLETWSFLSKRLEEPQITR